MSQLRELITPFPDRYVHSNPSGGGSYVKHAVIQQRLMQVLGPFTFEHVDTLYGDVAAIEPNPKGNSMRARTGAPALVDALVGVIARLRVTVDGRDVVVEEAGDCEQPHNWPHNGARMKDAMSDAFKRCSMRLGLGLSLWAQDDFFLFDKLSEPVGADSRQGNPAAGSDAGPVSAPGPAITRVGIDG